MHSQIRACWATFNAPLEGVVNRPYSTVVAALLPASANTMDETAHETSAPNGPDRASSLQLANEVAR